MSRFFCDSNCELWYDKVKALGIDYISMPYTLEGKEYYYDLGEKTDNREFFRKMRAGAAPKTSALNEQDYIDYFEPVFAAGEDIIYVTFSHKMSATFESMNKAIEKLKARYPERKITVADTRYISMGAGMVVYYAAKKHNEGASDEEVAEFVRTFREKVRIYFTVADLVYLKRGGRLSAFKYLMGGLFNVKPIIAQVDGKLDNIAKATGRKKSLKALVDYMASDVVDEDYPAILLNGDCDDDCAFTRALVEEKFPSVKLETQLIGPVIGSHCGPDTVGLVFVAK